MTHVHYKFSSKLSYDTVVFDGPHFTLGDLKRQIMGRERLRAGDCDLQITNAQTKEDYTDDEGLIPKGSSVIVRRIPVSGVKSGSGNKTHNLERSNNQHQHAYGAVKAMENQNSFRALSFFSKMANLADVDVSEEDKIKVVMNQSSYDSGNYIKKFGSVLPANYTCYRCGNTGHHIRNCPTSGDKNFEAPLRIKKSTGIPRSFMVEVDDPNIKGAMLTNCGRYAIPAIDAQAYAIGKKEKPPFVPQEQPKSEVVEDPIPDELLCLICRDLLNDAVVIPCCGNSYCDDCIRTTLLDSDEHICPTCSQSDVSPDTLIANKFLRQAVNNYKKERGYTKTLGRGSDATQSQNPTPFTIQSQPQKPYQSTQSQQDPLMPRPQAEVLPPLSRLSGAPPAATGAASASSTPSTSLQTPGSETEAKARETEAKARETEAKARETVVKAQETEAKAQEIEAKAHKTEAKAQEIEAKAQEAEAKTQEDEGKTQEDEGKTREGSVTAAPSVLVSNKDPSAAPSHLITLVNHASLADQPPPDSLNPHQSSLELKGPVPRQSGPSTCLDRSSPFSGFPTRGWTESNTSNTQECPPSSSLYSTTPPPLFPSPHFHTFLSAQQPPSSYPPRYPPATPIWTLPNHQGGPIPSLCSSNSSPSIPPLIQKEWFSHQKKKWERSPDRGSTYRRCSSRSNSKSSKSKSSRSYSHSSSRSRSRSRSRSQGRSRPRSPYSRPRDTHTNSHPSRSYSYGYKASRSPTPSSSSSPQVGSHSRSKSTTDHRKNRQPSRHHNKKSVSSGSSSRRRAEHSPTSGSSQRDKEDSGQSFASDLNAHHANQTSSLEHDADNYVQWKRQYKEWYEKYFSSYVGHFHQLPPPLLTLPPPPPNPLWGCKEENHSCSDGPKGRCTTLRDRRSHPCQSSSESRSPPSRSSSDSRSPPSNSSSDSRSPPSRSSSDTCSTPSEDGAHQSRCTEKDGQLPITPSVGRKEVERNKSDKQVNTKHLGDCGALKNEFEMMGNHEEGTVKEISSPETANSRHNSRNDKKWQNNRPNVSRTPALEEAAASSALESVQMTLKPDKPSNRNYERQSRERKNLERDKGKRRGKESDSWQDVERHHKVKPKEEASKVDTGRHTNSKGSKASDSKSERRTKGKSEDRSLNAKTQRLKTGPTEDCKTRKSESPKRFDREKQVEKKVESKTQPLTEGDIWEGGIKVKPQKKISINIILDGKREESDEKPDSSITETMVEKSKENIEMSGTGKEMLNSGEAGIQEQEKRESDSEQKGTTDDKVSREKWEQATFREDKEENAAGGEEDIDEKQEDKAVEEGDETEANKRDERKSVKEEEEKQESEGNDGSGKELEELIAALQEDGAEEGDACKENIRNSPEEELMEDVKRRMREEKDSMKSQSSRTEDPHDGPNTMVDGGSSTSAAGSRGGDERLERSSAVKTLEEYILGGEDKLSLTQAPHSKYEKEKFQDEEVNDRKINIQSFLMALSSRSVKEPRRETEGEKHRNRQESVEMHRGERTEERRDRDKERIASVTPSSGKDSSDSSLCPWSDGKTGLDGQRDGEKGRESERQNEMLEESETAKEIIHEDKGRDKEIERECSSTASVSKGCPPASTDYPASTSHDWDRRDRLRGGDQGSGKSSSRPDGKLYGAGSNEGDSIIAEVQLPDLKKHKTHMNISVEKKSEHKEIEPNLRYYHNHRDPTSKCSNTDEAAVTHRPVHHSLPHSWGKERESSGALQGSSEPKKLRMSSSGEELKQPEFSVASDQPDHWRSRSQHAATPTEPPRSRQDKTSEREKGRQDNRRRKESREEQWKRYKLDKAIKESKEERESSRAKAEREGGGRWKGEADKPTETARGRGRELEEGERPGNRSSSASSSASQGNGKDERRRERKKEKKHKEKHRQADTELEDGEQKKHKKPSRRV